MISIEPSWSLSPWIRIVWSPLVELVARMERDDEKTGWYPDPAPKLRPLLKLIDSSIGPSVSISTPSPGAAASMQA
ncbi:MAG TPA: hypothetical protein VMU39_16105 [Solirubrobacteraceae bacterium]|nr:hypothetical protein [Solirubrobacteraceae bacterium]